MTLFAVSALGASVAGCFVLAGVAVLAAGLVRATGPAPVRSFPEARMAMGPAAPARPASRPCPDCGGGVGISGHEGEAVAACAECSWSLTQRRNVA